MITAMTKKERIREAARMFYEFCDRNDFIADDEGFGYWMVAKIGTVRSDQMFQVNRGNGDFDVCTHLCECEEALEFAKRLEEHMDNVKRMMEL
jgi:hypothetical protein